MSLLADPTIKGHPVIELDTGADEPTLITVCGHCGEMRTIILLVKDRWYCSKCRAEGATPPNLYPVA